MRLVPNKKNPGQPARHQSSCQHPVADCALTTHQKCWGSSWQQNLVQQPPQQPSQQPPQEAYRSLSLPTVWTSGPTTTALVYPAHSTIKDKHLALNTSQTVKKGINGRPTPDSGVQGPHGTETTSRNLSNPEEGRMKITCFQ
ncbi:hypothetical protein C0Q70_07957 [Pomacea canaliculata]|uniref:Uncharacterized protein n=1 Tax=Pomacea canaliculata TaxID=400727 RepID=A0A2T7PGH5_POMCA|nr:hypothetical protein C0Q70_07957 [Pomacea canaliculata]